MKGKKQKKFPDRSGTVGKDFGFEETVRVDFMKYITFFFMLILTYKS